MTSNLMTPNKLVEDNLVSDAGVAQEYWYARPLSVPKPIYIQITNYHESGVDVAGNLVEENYTGECDNTYIYINDVQYIEYQEEEILFNDCVIRMLVPFFYHFDTSPYQTFWRVRY